MGTLRSHIWDVKHVLAIPIPDPGGAGVELTNYIAFKAPKNLTITKLWHVPNAAWVAAAAANDGRVICKRNNTGTNIALLSVVTNLAIGTVNDMGALDGTTKKLQESDNLTVDIGAVGGAGTANGPASTLVVEFEYDPA